MNAFLLQRYMLHSDWHLGKSFRVFVQLKSGLEDSRAGGIQTQLTRRVSLSTDLVIQ
jgi:hypothetical protein